MNVRAAAMSRRVKAQRVRPVWRDPARSDAIPPVRRPSSSCSAISDRRAASRYMGTRCKQQQAMSQVETRTAVGSLPDAIEQTRLRFDTPQSPGELPDAGIEPEHAEGIASAILQSAAAWGHSRVARSELATFQDSMKSDMETFQDAGKSQSAVLRSDVDGRCPDIGSLRISRNCARSSGRSGWMSGICARKSGGSVPRLRAIWPSSRPGSRTACSGWRLASLERRHRS